MEQLVGEYTKYLEEINDLKQVIYTLEAVNDMLQMENNAEQARQHYADWMVISDQKSIFNILTSYDDSIKKLILEELAKNSMSIQEIIQKYDLPQASTYRKVTELIDCGLIMKHGFFLQKDSKRVYKYIAAIKNMRIHFIENKISLSVLPVKRSEFQNICKNPA